MAEPCVNNQTTIDSSAFIKECSGNLSKFVAVVTNTSQLLETIVAELREPGRVDKLGTRRQQAFGTRYVPTVIGFCNKHEVNELRADITDILSEKIGDYFRLQNALVFIRPLKDALKFFYSIRSGELEHPVFGTVKWSRSVVPLFVNFQFKFVGSDDWTSYYAYIDCIPDREKLRYIGIVFKMAKMISVAREDALQKEIQEAYQHFQSQGQDGLFVISNIIKMKHEQERQERTKREWADLLTIDKDPILDYAHWSSRISRLATAVNYDEVDISRFDNLRQIAAAREAWWTGAGISTYLKYMPRDPETETRATVASELENKAPTAPAIEKKAAMTLGVAHKAKKAKKKSNRKARLNRTETEPPLSSGAGVNCTELSGAEIKPHKEEDRQVRSTSSTSCPRPNLLSANQCFWYALPTDVYGFAPHTKLEARSDISSICEDENPSHPKLDIPVNVNNIHTQSSLLDSTISTSDDTNATAECTNHSSHTDSANVSQPFDWDVQSQVNNGAAPLESSLVERLQPFPEYQPTVESLFSQRPSIRRSLSCFNFSTPSNQSMEQGQDSKEEKYLEDEFSDEDVHTNSEGRGSTRTSIELPAYQTWALSVTWFYYDPGNLDLRMLRPDVYPYMRPPGWLPDVELQNKLPVMVKAARSDTAKPLFEYDEIWNRLVITPSLRPLTDIRQLDWHPDWLPENKLVEYQAVEMAGHIVWRHDRNYLPCTLPDCRKSCTDHNLTTQICLGCGPRSTVRYCSKMHQIQDMQQHWEECRHPSTLLNYYVDCGTQPSRFSRRYPAIDDVADLRSYEKYRQRAHFIWNRGQYSLFYQDHEPVPVEWPSIEQQYQYGPRVERCMNAAFFDQTRDVVVEYLFYLVRMALRMSGKYHRDAARLLHHQFIHEFDWNSDAANEEDPCECRWLGNEADGRYCNAECVERHRRLGLTSRGPGVKRILEPLENKYWILRIWQRQHPDVHGWRRRLCGEGFPGARRHDLTKERPLMGRGWMGFGAPDTFGGWEDIV